MSEDRFEVKWLDEKSKRNKQLNEFSRGLSEKIQHGRVSVSKTVINLAMIFSFSNCKMMPYKLQ